MSQYSVLVLLSNKSSVIPRISRASSVFLFIESLLFLIMLSIKPVLFNLPSKCGSLKSLKDFMLVSVLDRVSDILSVESFEVNFWVPTEGGLVSEVDSGLT